MRAWSLLLIGLALVACDTASTDFLSTRSSNATDASAGDIGGGDVGEVAADAEPRDAQPADGGFMPCTALDEAACRGRADCLAKSCSTCDGVAFVGCLDPIDDFPCPRPACPPCDGFSTEAACGEWPYCEWQPCPDCGGTSPLSGFCYQQGESPPTCPAIVCPPCHVVREQICVVRTDCHAVFSGPQECPCDAPGCCSEFLFCAEGPATCSAIGPITCLIPPLRCEGPYTIGFVPACFEGCVLRRECSE